MLCSECGKNQATVFLKVAINNKVTELCLCGACAAKKSGGLNMETGLMNTSEIMLDMGGFFREFLPREKKSLHCPECGLKYSEFKERGKLGCPECYKSFEAQLTELLSGIHGSHLHTGRKYRLPEDKQPRPRSGETRKNPPDPASADELKKLLREAVEKEDFETAAELRDRLKKAGGADA